MTHGVAVIDDNGNQRFGNITYDETGRQVDTGGAFNAPLTHLLRAIRGNLVQFDGDDGDATITDWEGIVRDTQAEEARFVGARRVENLANNLRDWNLANLGNFTIETDLPDPDGGNSVVRITCNSAITSSFLNTATGLMPEVADGDVMIASLSARLADGSTTPSGAFTWHTGDGVTTYSKALTTSWQRLAPNSAASELAPTLGNMGLNVHAWEVGESIEFYAPQFEIVTGQVNQNPSEYVSVGVGTEAESSNDVSFDTVLEGELSSTHYSWLERRL